MSCFSHCAHFMVMLQETVWGKQPKKLFLAGFEGVPQLTLLSLRCF